VTTEVGKTVVHFKSIACRSGITVLIANYIMIAGNVEITGFRRRQRKNWCDDPHPTVSTVFSNNIRT